MKSSKVLALVLILILLSSVTAAETTFIGLGTGGATGAYYALGGEFSKLWKDHIEGLNLSVQTTGGSKANILLMNDGDIELAISQNDVAYYAYQGDEAFFDGTVIDSFFAVGTLFPEFIQIVVPADSDIRQVSELKNKVVSLGAIGSGSYFNGIQVLAEAGLSIDDIRIRHLSYEESCTSFQNMQLDAFFVTSPTPHTSIIEANTKRPIRLITLDQDQMSSLIANYSFYTPSLIPANTYEGFDQDIVVPAVNAMLICSKDLDESLVYELTRVLYENIDEITNAKKQYINIENAVNGVPVPFHPGAEKYYRDNGFIND